MLMVIGEKRSTTWLLVTTNSPLYTLLLPLLYLPLAHSPSLSPVQFTPMLSSLPPTDFFSHYPYSPPLYHLICLDTTVCIGVSVWRCVSGWQLHQNEFACELRISFFGKDSPLPPRLLQRLAIRHKQAHRHQTSWQERVGLLFGSETVEEGTGKDL